MSKRNNLIDNILAKSEALVNTQSKKDGIPHIKRGIEELEESVRRSDAKAQDLVGVDAKAYRLLNQNAKFDAENLTKEIISMDFKIQSEPLQALEGTNIEGYLSHHHDMIFLSIIDEARKKTENDVRATQIRWEREEWENSRKDFMDSLGHRSQAWDGGPNNSFLTLTTTNGATPRKAIGGTDLFSSPGPSALEIFPGTSHGSLWVGSSVKNSQSSLTNTDTQSFSVSSTSSVMEATKRTEALQLPLLREHANATRTLHMIDQCDTAESVNATPTPCSDFLASLPLTLTMPLNQFDICGEKDLKGYRFLLSLIAAMTGEKRPPSGRNIPGYFSLVVADSHYQSSTTELRIRRDLLSKGAREHLEYDYRNDVVKPESIAYMRNVTGSNRQFDQPALLESSPDFGQNDTTLLEEVQKYVSATLPQPSHSSFNYNIDFDNNGVLLWPQVYTCIRVGALPQARDLLKQDEVYYNYCCAIEGLMQLTGNGGKYSPNDILGFIVKCKVEYNEAINSEVGYEQLNAPLDSEESLYELQYQYKLQVLNLLGFVSLDALCNGEHLPGTTIEDFLWINLWFRHWSHILEEKIPSNKGVVLPSVVNESDIFYRVMEAGGAEDYDPHGSLAFEFAMILCCCHQFGGAIEHLYQHGKIFPAVHLLVICLHYGLVLPYLPLAMPMQGARSNSTPQDLLQTWVYSSKVPLTITQKVDYLVALDSAWVNNNPKKTETQSYKSDEVRTEVLTRLLCDVDDASMTLLVIGYEGEQIGGYLRNYLSEDRLNHLLHHAATVMSANGSLLHRAIKFYDLAGDYVEVFEELNDQLSKVLIPTNSSSSLVASQKLIQDRSFWFKFSEDFKAKHFAGGDNLGAVVKALSTMGRGDLIHVFHLLLKLVHFVQLHDEKKFKEALEFMKSLRILPCNVNEKIGKIEEFNVMDSAVRRVMDDVLILYMESIFEVYQEKRRDIANFSQYRKLLEDLRDQANLLISFTGQVQKKLSRADTIHRLLDYQSRMASD